MGETKIKKIPEMYLFFYCNLKNHSDTSVLRVGDAETLIGHQVPRILRKHILQEMVDFGLIKRINRKEIEIAEVNGKKLNKWNIEVDWKAIDDREKNLQKEQHE